MKQAFLYAYLLLEDHYLSIEKKVYAMYNYINYICINGSWQDLNPGAGNSSRKELGESVIE